MKMSPQTSRLTYPLNSAHERNLPLIDSEFDRLEWGNDLGTTYRDTGLLPYYRNARHVED